VRTTIVIPTVDAREILGAALRSLSPATADYDVVVIDNASSDGTAAMIEQEFPDVEVVRNAENRGFGRAINEVALALEGDVLVLLNNDVICRPHFIERLREPLQDPAVGMVAGVLTLLDQPELVDSAGLELDRTLKSWDFGRHHPVSQLDPGHPPVGPCGGAAAYRMQAFQEMGGFDETLFAYWEDVDLAIRLTEAGWRCALVPDAVAEHRHGATLGGRSSAKRTLDAFGRGYILGKYGVVASLRARVAAALLDWPVLLGHLISQRDAGPIRARRRGIAVGRERAGGPVPEGVATLSMFDSQRRLWQLQLLRLRGALR
jgi:N-acetylglucosaminyl-diphospho-decaprenol L-rhamnosyltransferase